MKRRLIPAALVLVLLATPADETLEARLAELQARTDAGHYAEVVEQSRALLEEVEARHGPQSLEAAAVLDRLVSALWLSGDLGEGVEALARRAVKIREDLLGAEAPELGDSLNTLANFYFMTGRYADAGGLYRRCAKIFARSRGPRSAETAKALNNLGITHLYLGQLGEARDYLERALAIREELWGKDDPRLARTVLNLANVWLTEKNIAEALSYLERALGMIEAQYGTDHPDRAMVLVMMGNAYTDLGRWEEALSRYREAAEVSERTLGPDHRDVGHALINLSSAHWFVGNVAESRRLLQRALEIYEKAVGPDHPDLARLYMNMGFMAMETGRYEEAEKHYRRGLTIARQRRGEQHRDTAEGLFYLADFYVGTGRPAEGLELALQSEAVTRADFGRVSSGLSESEALAYDRLQRSGLDRAIEALVAFGDEIPAAAVERTWDQLIRSRGMVMDEVASRRQLVAAGRRPELAELVRAVDAARGELAALAVRGTAGASAEEYLAELQAARSAREAAERRLAAKSLPFRQQRDRDRRGLAEVRRALPDGTALVALAQYSRYSRKEEGEGYTRATDYVAFVVPADGGAVRFRVLGRAGEIDRLVSAWKGQVGKRPPLLPQAARAAERRAVEAGTALADALWRPLADLVGGARRVLVVPEGAVHLVSFATLPAEGRSGYLAQAGPSFHYLAAERDVVSHRPRSGAGLVAFGAPAFDLDRSNERAALPSGTRGLRRGLECDGLAAMEFPPLSGSAAEVTDLAALWERSVDGPVRVLTGRQADEATLRRLAPGSRVLHLATHGFFVQDRCELVTRPDTRARAFATAINEEQARRLVEDPFLQSGLALAGANGRRGSDAETDGILTAQEVAGIDLSEVEWVVLSACETGVGTVQQGEGVLGLRRAFETAGAATLIMSLWPVDDEATRDWMAALYRRRIEGRDTSDAMRQAAVDVLDARRRAGRSTHPFYWGAFVAAGDWR